MIKGIGNDIIEIKRIKSSIERHQERFLDRVFTKNEQYYCLQYNDSAVLHFAGRFSAKEAIVKALGTGFRYGISWLDIEILNDEVGKPHLTPNARLDELFSRPKFYLSISHCNEYATAVAVWVEP